MTETITPDSQVRESRKHITDIPFARSLRDIEDNDIIDVIFVVKHALEKDGHIIISKRLVEDNLDRKINTHEYNMALYQIRAMNFLRYFELSKTEILISM